MIRVILPAHLRALSGVEGEATLALTDADVLSTRSLLDALEARHPALRGAIRDHVTKDRRAFIRFFVCGRDVSHDSPDEPLPGEVATGAEPFIVLAAIAGG